MRLRSKKTRAFLVSGIFSMLALSCSVQPEPPTVSDAEEFVAAAEERLLDLWMSAGQAAWVQQNFISIDTNAMTASANAAVMAATTELATEAAQFNSLELPEALNRKLTLLKTSLAAVAPADPVLQQELAEILAGMEAAYGQGEYCTEEGCLDLPQMEAILAESRETDELLDAWSGWRSVSPALRHDYQRFVEIANAGAVELGFTDMGEMWRSSYDMEPDEFRAELERLWEQVRPLYESLHCLVRAELGEAYGTAVVDEAGLIPAHLLGNMWSQSWSNVYELVAPDEGGLGYDLTRQLERNGVDELEMVRFAEQFFSSLGFEPLPETFWERSLFIQPDDRDVVCHASAWSLDYEDDIRIKMCIRITGEDFVVVHHELGHNYYQRAYQHQDPLYRTSANDGFHEGIGDTVALSITPEYLVKTGLLNRVPADDGDIGLLLGQALDKIAFLPFGLLVDQWRWQVFSGEITPDRYNEAWWELRKQYQGVRSPLVRDETLFDPGAKYHVPANVPYTRYFLAHILQFQFHRALCAAAGNEGALHRCSVFESEDAGALLREMLEMGASQPWPDALEVIAGTRQMDATAILDYFAPLQAWLDEQNANRQCGW
jgi:peptidyl-dipeptidase A